MKNDNDVDTLLARAKENGVATALVSDGRLFVFSKTKLLDMIAEMEVNDKNHIVIMIKDPSKIN